LNLGPQISQFLNSLTGKISLRISKEEEDVNYKAKRGSKKAGFAIKNVAFR
jgi:hypothetical protein